MCIRDRVIFFHCLSQLELQRGCGAFQHGGIGIGKAVGHQQQVCTGLQRLDRRLTEMCIRDSLPCKSFG